MKNERMETQIKKKEKNGKIFGIILLLFGIFIFLNCNLVFASTWTSNLNNGLVSYWKLDINDSTGMTPDSLGINNGTIGTSGGIKSISGIINNSYNFSSSLKLSLNFSNPSNFNDIFSMGVGKNFTISMWVYQTPSSDTATRGFITKGVEGSSGGYMVNTFGKDDRTANSNKLMVFTESGSGNYRRVLTVNNVISSGAWYHIVFRSNGTGANGQIGIFVNGTEVATVLDSGGGSYPSNVATLRPVTVGVGMDPTSASQYWNGGIDEVGIWNRSLNSSEISDLYNSGVGITYNSVSSSDTSYPKFTNNSFFPSNATYSNSGLNYYFNITITSTNGTAGISFNGVNYSMSNSSNIFNETFFNLSSGTYPYYYWAYGNGTSNLFNSSQTYSYTTFIDNVNPLINIIYPLNQNYSVSPSVLNYSFTEINPNYCWYSVNNGIVNNTISCGNNVSINSQQGWNNWTVGIIDLAGNKNSTSVSFFVDSLLPVFNLNFPINNTYSNIKNNNFTANSFDSGIISCYQESMNFTNQNGNDTQNCGLNYSGNVISKSGNFMSICDVSGQAWNDGNLSSCIGSADISGINLVYYYVKPQNAVSSLLTVKFGYSNPPPFVSGFNLNISIPDSCFNYNSTALNIKFNSISGGGSSYTSTFQCLNLTGWNTIYTSTQLNVGQLYEEAMIWNVSSLSLTSSGLKNSTLSIYNQTSNVLINKTSINFSASVFNYSLSIPVLLNDGVYLWGYQGFDNFGNKGTSQNNTLTIDTTYPLINFTSGTPDNNSAIDSGNLFMNVIWTESNFANITFRVNSSYQTFTNHTYNYTFVGLINGYHNFDVTICDLVGQCNTTETRQVLLNTGNPTAEQGTTSGGVFYNLPNNSVINSSSTQNFSVNATDQFGIKNVTINITNSSGQTVGTINQSFSGDFFSGIVGLPLTLANGVYNFFVSAYNTVGNAFTSVITFTMDYDGSYPIFYNYQANPSGSNVIFSINVNNTNGTVKLNVNGTSYNAMNLSLNQYFVSVSSLVNDTNYYYNWSSFGNGNHHNINYSNTYLFNQMTYVPPVIVNPSGIQEYFIPTQYPYVETNTSVNILFKILNNGTEVNDTGLNLLVNGSNFVFTQQPSLFNITVLFNSTGDYPFTVLPTNNNYTNFSGIFYVRDSYNITICGFNDKSGTPYKNNFAYLVAEYKPNQYNANLDQFLTPLSYAQSNIPVFSTNYVNGCGTLRLYEPNRDYVFRLFDGKATFSSPYSVPNITETYGTNILLGQYKMNGTSENLDVYLSPKDISPYFWLLNVVMIIVIILVVIISVILFFWFSDKPSFALIFFIMGTLGTIILRIIIYFWIGY